MKRVDLICIVSFSNTNRLEEVLEDGECLLKALPVLGLEDLVTHLVFSHHMWIFDMTFVDGVDVVVTRRPTRVDEALDSKIFDEVVGYDILVEVISKFDHVSNTRVMLAQELDEEAETVTDATTRDHTELNTFNSTDEGCTVVSCDASNADLALVEDVADTIEAGSKILRRVTKRDWDQPRVGFYAAACMGCMGCIAIHASHACMHACI